MRRSKLIPIARRLRRDDTWAERLLWRWLRARRFSNYKFRRQHPCHGYVLDFFCPEARLNIELDGGQHGSEEERAHDAARDAALAERGIQVLRIWNGRLRREKEWVLTQIWQALQERAPHPLPGYCQPHTGLENQRNPAPDCGP